MSTVQWMPGLTLEKLEEMVIRECLRFNKGNKMQTASMLGITTKTLYNKIDKYDEIEKTVEQNRLERKNRFQQERDDFRNHALLMQQHVESASRKMEDSLPVPKHQKSQNEKYIKEMKEREAIFFNKIQTFIS